MSKSSLDIWNMALSAAQEKAGISDPNENTKHANLCRIWYDTARRKSLMAGAWPCASTYVRLAVVAQRGTDAEWVSTHPAPGFQYAYALPNDLIAPQYLHDWGRFEQVVVDGQRAIVTNTESAILRYTFDQENPAEWDEGLILTVSTFLGALICKNINGKLGLYDRLLREAKEFAAISQAEIANMESVEFAAIPPNLVARGYAGSPSQTRYFFPFAQLSGVNE